MRGIGVISLKLSKQKLKTTSLTKAELISTSDCLLKLSLHQYFIEAQEYLIKNNIILQDNKSTILIAKNCYKIYNKRSRYIYMRYFYITDLIGNDNIAIEYYLPEKMLLDFFSNLLHENLFKQFKDTILEEQPML